MTKIGPSLHVGGMLTLSGHDTSGKTKRVSEVGQKSARLGLGQPRRWSYTAQFKTCQRKMCA